MFHNSASILDSPVESNNSTVQLFRSTCQQYATPAMGFQPRTNSSELEIVVFGQSKARFTKTENVHII